jgi:hypothetical protein
MQIDEPAAAAATAADGVQLPMWWHMSRGMQLAGQHGSVAHAAAAVLLSFVFIIMHLRLQYSSVCWRPGCMRAHTQCYLCRTV